MMRIITGSARGTKLATLEGEATRPTAERVKEAVFSMIQFDIEGREVLDLFAGSGQLALEALSRGAARASMVDASRDALEIIKANAQKTHLFDRCRLSMNDYRAYLRGAAGRDRFHLIFLDPPYASDFLADALALIADGAIAAPGAILVCESGEEDIFADHAELAAKYHILRKARYSKTYITLLTPAPEA